MLEGAATAVASSVELVEAIKTRPSIATGTSGVFAQLLARRAGQWRQELTAFEHYDHAIARRRDNPIRKIGL